MKLFLYIVILTAYTVVSSASVSSVIRNHTGLLVPRLTDTRIVGGNPVSIEKYPHQVNLRKRYWTTSEPYRHWCGASIYSERIVITAAHCLYRALPSHFKVVAGSTNREGNDGYIVPVENFITHEMFNTATLDNDIAILVLGASLPLNNFTMKAIELAENDNELLDGRMATVTGWGSLKSGGSYPTQLQEVHLPIVNNKVCNNAYHGRISEAMICAGYHGAGGKDACQGDSGGPLVLDGKLIGVVSWGEGCARPDFPGVYSKVSHLRPWLIETIRKINFHYLNK